MNENTVATAVTVAAFQKTVHRCIHNSVISKLDETNETSESTFNQRSVSHIENVFVIFRAFVSVSVSNNNIFLSILLLFFIFSFGVYLWHFSYNNNNNINRNRQTHWSFFMNMILIQIYDQSHKQTANLIHWINLFFLRLCLHLIWITQCHLFLILNTFECSVDTFFDNLPLGIRYGFHWLSFVCMKQSLADLWLRSESWRSEFGTRIYSDSERESRARWLNKFQNISIKSKFVRREKQRKWNNSSDRKRSLRIMHSVCVFNYH